MLEQTPSKINSSIHQGFHPLQNSKGSILQLGDKRQLAKALPLPKSLLSASESSKEVLLSESCPERLTNSTSLLSYHLCRGQSLVWDGQSGEPSLRQVKEPNYQYLNPHNTPTKAGIYGSTRSPPAFTHHKLEAPLAAQHAGNTRSMVQLLHPCAKHQHLNSEQGYTPQTRYIKDAISINKQQNLFKKHVDKTPLPQNLTPFKLLGPSREIHILNKEDEERSESTVQVEDDIDGRHLDIKTVMPTTEKHASIDLSFLSVLDTKNSKVYRLSQSDEKLKQKLQNKMCLTIHYDESLNHSEEIRQCIEEASVSQAEQKKGSNSPDGMSVTSNSVNTLPSCQTEDENNFLTTPRVQMLSVKAAKVYNRKQGGEVAYAATGTSFVAFLSEHPLIKGIRLHKGKRQVKKELVRLCHNKDSADPITSVTQTSSSLTSGSLTDTYEAGKIIKASNTDRSKASVSSQVTSPFKADIKSKVQVSKASPDKWHRGKDLLERNNLDDCFTLTDEGKLLLTKVQAGQARDQYVVNWYLWCPGRTNCHRKCGGFGKCIAGEHFLNFICMLHNFGFMT